MGREVCRYEGHYQLLLLTLSHAFNNITYNERDDSEALSETSAPRFWRKKYWLVCIELLLEYDMIANKSRLRTRLVATSRTQNKSKCTINPLYTYVDLMFVLHSVLKQYILTGSWCNA